MRQWDIYLYPFQAEQPHPVVVLSTDERCINPDLPSVNALFCTSVRFDRGLKGNEALLDEADGLDWKTAVRCDVIHLLPKPNFLGRRGRVSERRRVQITQKIILSLRLPTY